MNICLRCKKCGASTSYNQKYAGGEEILNMDFTGFLQEAIQDLRRTSDEGVREFKEGVASLFQERAA